MSMRMREYVLLGITVFIGVVYSLLGRGWSDMSFYSGGAGILVVLVVVGMSWVELAPDGAFRRRSQS